MHRSRPVVLLIAALGHCALVPAASDPTDAVLEEVTVSALRSEAPVTEVPATVSVIGAARMEQQLVQNIEDLVRYEPGVSVRTAPARFTAALATTGRDGNSGFNIRGLEGNRVLIQVDGVRMPEAYSFGAQSVGRGDYVDLGLLKSVEILRGPASALYGSDGLAGAVSFIMKDPGDLLGPDRNFTARLHSSYAQVSDSTAHGLVTAGRMGEWEVLAAYTRRDGEGRKTGGSNDAANTDRTTANPEDNRSNSALVRVVRELGAHGRVRLTWDHLDRDVDWNVLSAITKPPASGPLPATAVLGVTAFDAVSRNRYALDHFHEPAAAWIDSVRTTLSWQSSKTRQFSAEDRNTAADRTRDAHFDTLVRGISIEGRSSVDGARIAQRLVYGVDASRTRQRSLRDGTVPPFGESFPSRAFPITDYTLVGVFLQDELDWGRFSLIPALRWDHFELNPEDDPLFTAAVPATLRDSQLSPKLGALLRLEQGWNVFANAASGFKAPEPGQVNNGFSNPASNYMSISNPGLKPETSRTLELGLRREGARWSAGLTGYTGTYDDFIDMAQVAGDFTDPQNPAVFQFVNLADARISGVELKAGVRLPQELQWTLAGAWSRGSYRELDGARVPLDSIDPVRITTGLDWNPAGRSFGGQLMATFAWRKQASRIGMACTGGCYAPGSHGVVDVTGWWRPAQQVTLRAGLFNALDKHYASWSDVRGLSQTSTVRDAYFNPGRNLSASVTVQF